MQEINVKMGEIELTTKPGTILKTPGLGSGVGFAVYDKKARMAGMAHIVLPDSTVVSNPADEKNPGKYADISIPALLGKMLSLGSKKENLVIKIAGGAQMFNIEGNSNAVNIGYRNVKSVYNAVEEMGLTVTRADTGGSIGRMIKLNALNGTFYLTVIGQKEVEF